MELIFFLPGSDNELLIPSQDPPLQDLHNRLISSEGSHDSWIRHRQERLFCAACQRFSEEPCWFHAKSVSNESVVPFALASLPKILRLDVCPNSSTGKKVVANARIPPHTVFGPLVAPLAEKYSDTCVYAFPSPDDGQLRFFQLDSELFSNWMRYVRFAENLAEENLAVYLRASQIVFVSLRTILPGEELKVCLSVKYAAIIERANTLSWRLETERCCVTAIGSAKHTEHPPPLDPPKTPLEPCSNIIPADWDSDSLQAPIMTGNNESSLPNFQNSPHTLPSRALAAHIPDRDDSVRQPVKRRCLADISATALSLLLPRNPQICEWTTM
ncbi:uncharacterized protein LOC129602415 [Paramacrobiotus metropolitanus]|uniref:uncharacterized protein LOC129602415 n=1 Tax=Paramacrobiotus metropolitanus TaxID=2943436 RepID=UPI0024461659|nr:uncharacterized protein LOC129602415 [Paramacrobiotus metropolitanus]